MRTFIKFRGITSLSRFNHNKYMCQTNIIYYIHLIWNAQLLLFSEILFSASSLVIIYSFLTIESFLKDRTFIQYLIIFTFLFAIRGSHPSSARFVDFFNPNIFLQNLVCNISISYDLWCSRILEQ